MKHEAASDDFCGGGPWEPTTFIFRGYNPFGLKTFIFPGFGVQGDIVFNNTHGIYVWTIYLHLLDFQTHRLPNTWSRGGYSVQLMYAPEKEHVP